MSKRPLLTGTEAEQAMYDGLIELIADRLRDRIYDHISADIEEAVQTSIKALEIRIKSMYQMDSESTLIKVIIARKDKANEPS